jgi:hypothetical protein
MAADIQAGSAEAGLALRVFPFVHADGFEAQLGTPYGGDIAAGSSAYDSYIKRRLVHVSGQNKIRIRG